MNGTNSKEQFYIILHMFDFVYFESNCIGKQLEFNSKTNKCTEDYCKCTEN